MSFFSLNIKTAGLLTAMYSIVTSLTRIYGGKIADKNGGESTATISLIIALVGAIFMTFAGSITIAVIGVLLLGIGMGVAHAAVFKIVPNVVPDAIGGASGWIGGIGAFGGFVIPPLMASFIDKSGKDLSGFPKGFVIFIALIAISLLIMWLFKIFSNKKALA